MPGLAAADHRRAERRGDVVVVDELEGDAGIGEDRPQRRAPAQRPAQRPRDLSAEGDAAGSGRAAVGRVRAGDDAGAEDVGVGVGARERLLQQRPRPRPCERSRDGAELPRAGRSSVEQRRAGLRWKP